MTRLTFFILVLFLVLDQMVYGLNGIETISSDLVSDGINHVTATLSENCEPTYGFLPCTTNLSGKIFLIVVYQYALFLGERYISASSQLIFEILGPGFFGGSASCILGSFSEAILVLVSGLFVSKQKAQKQVEIGMGLVAGSTVMLLTVLWGSCVVVGKIDIQDDIATDLRETKRSSLTGSGIKTDVWTSYTARIMTMSMIPFVIVQLPQIFHSSAGNRLAILSSIIVSVALLVSYCLFQIFQPWIQKRRHAYIKHKRVISGILRHLKQQAGERLLTDDGEPNVDVLRKLFKATDLNGDGHLSPLELRALIIGIQFEVIDLDREDAVRKVLLDFDTSGDAVVNEDEFILGISKWINEVERASKNARKLHSSTSKYLNNFYQQINLEEELLGDQSDEIVEGDGNVKRVSIKAGLLLLLGIGIATLFAGPLVDAVDDFATATSIPSFFISFIALPLATRSSEAVEALKFARRKEKGTSSLTFSEIYGTVTVNNLLCLAVFLALVYVRDITWNFSAEVLVICIVCTVMGLLASFRTVFPLWTCLVAYVLYPFSLALVYVLNSTFGWA